jgi:tetratricopeptide (TPR) repeat protein
MKRIHGLWATTLFAGLVAGLPVLAQESHQHHHDHGPVQLDRLGRVEFLVSCSESVQPLFNTAVALLHSFWYSAAEETFAEVAHKDPDCAMAYWGIAMSRYHPLWVRPGPEDLKAAWAAVEKAKALGARTARERDWIAAIETFYKDHSTVDHVARVEAYEKAMEELHRRYPHDLEATVFYALALQGTAAALPPDKELVRQKKSGELLEPIFAKYPEHPGLAHYVIHAYDYPPLAHRALEAARRYAKVAPESAHALHMPSHIFTRLGMWEESIASNLDSAAAARKAKDPGEERHAMDYLMYAYLQTARDSKARELLERMPPPAQKTSPLYFAGVFAVATMPARYAIERRAWHEAASLVPPAGELPGGRFAWADANFYFARGLAAARTGKAAEAKLAIEKLEAYREILLKEKEPYWADQVEIQRQIVAAWTTWAEGRQEEALKQLRAAADLEDATEKHPVTPGPIVPARELLGEMLLEMKRPSQAVTEFEAVLERSPNRLRALYGAARAAREAGDRLRARHFYTKLVELAKTGDGERPELREAEQFLAEYAKA